LGTSLSELFLYGLCLTEIIVKDQPGRGSESDHEPCWQDELENNTRLKKILSVFTPDSYNLHRKELSFICKTVLSHLSIAQADSASSKNVEYLTELFTEFLVVCSPLLKSSSLYALSNPTGPGANSSPEERQLTAKLHAHYGVPCTSDDSPEPKRIHPYARARVYDLRKYTDNTSWGPFLDDTTQGVDWEKIEAIMIVLHYNLFFYVSTREGGKFPMPMWEKPFLGVTPYSFVSQPRLCPHMPAPPEPASSLTNLLFSTHDSDSDKEADAYTTRVLSRCVTLPMSQRDPFCVTGTWLRVVCFLDYSELFQFNFGIDEQFHYTLEEKPDMDPLDTEEAVRMIVMRLKVTKIRAPNLDSEDGECDYKGWPVVEFKGTSRSLHSSWDPNANSFIRGIRGSLTSKSSKQSCEIVVY